jgi:hypothetical protein
MVTLAFKEAKTHNEGGGYAYSRLIKIHRGGVVLAWKEK